MNDQKADAAAASAGSRTDFDRGELIIFAMVGFAPAALFELAMHRSTGDMAAWTIGRELPVRAAAAVSLVLATWIMARRQHRSIGDFGLPLAEAFGWRFWLGAVFGFGMLSALLLALHETGNFDVAAVALTRGAVPYYAIAWGGVFLGVAFAEELAFRGYLFYMAAQRIGFWRAAFALSVGFAVSHIPNQGETPIGLLHVLATGFLFCFALRRTGSLWFVIGYHAAWDWAESFFYGTPDSGLIAAGHYLNTSIHGPSWLSGGSAGPEGSLVSIAVLALAALLIHLLFPTVRYPAAIVPAPSPS